MELSINKGKSIVLIDDEDLALVSRYAWRLLTNHGRTVYAVSGRGPHHILMHRLIMNCPDGLFVDHINHNGLDNRRCNLRLATKQQNQANRRPVKNKSSQYLGVHLTKRGWCAQIQSNYKVRNLGFYMSEVEAAIAYNKAAIELHRDFANLNIIP